MHYALDSFPAARRTPPDQGQRLHRRSVQQEDQEVQQHSGLLPLRGGTAQSKYPAYLSLTTNPRIGLHGGRASGSFANKITDTSDPKAVGDTAPVDWSVRGVRFSTQGLSATVHVTVSGPKAICPFSLKNTRLFPLLDIPGNS